MKEPSATAPALELTPQAIANGPGLHTHTPSRAGRGNQA
jgi:hypothetical protein